MLTETITDDLRVEMIRYGNGWVCLIRFRIFTSGGNWVTFYGGQITPWFSFKLPTVHIGPARGM